MKFHDAATFRRALEQRLEESAEGDEWRLTCYRRRVVFDRLLARLVALAPSQWALEGGFALDLRLARRREKTWQLELEWKGDHFSAFREVSREIPEYDVGDFFEFEFEESGGGVMGGSAFSNFVVHASLAGNPFETVSFASSFRRREIPTEMVRTEDLLAFAGIEQVEVEAVSIELQAAEKMYRYASAYADVVESRGAEHLLDLSAIAARSCPNPAFLREAIASIFESHNAELPEELHRPPLEWAAPFSQLAEAAGTPDELAAGHDAAAALLDPVLGDRTGDGIWNAAKRQWVGWPDDGRPPSGPAQP
jgi:hypothetical protein